MTDLRGRADAPTPVELFDHPGRTIEVGVKKGLPYKGFLNVAPMYDKEVNHSAQDGLSPCETHPLWQT
jgi:hypothetical protein